MKKETIMKRLLTLTGAGLLAFILLSCDIALGTMINMDGPILKITEPVLEVGMDEIIVPSVFTLRGTVESKNAISLLDITIEYYYPLDGSVVLLGRQWQYEGGWRYKKDSDVPWSGYTDSDYYLDDGDAAEAAASAAAEPPAWKKPEKTVYWNVPILMKGLIPGTGTGYYFITVKAWDSTGNHDANSVQKLKVYYFSDSPEITFVEPLSNILSPPRMSDGIKRPLPSAAMESYIYDPYERSSQTREYIKNWITDEGLTLRYRVKEESPAPFTLVLELTNIHNVETGEGKEVYYTQLFEGLSALSSHRGYIDIPGEEFEKIFKAHPDWKSNEPHYMQVVTHLTDSLGKSADQYMHGFIAYLPDAANPWVDASFAFIPRPPAPADSADRSYLIRGERRTSNSAWGRNTPKTLSWVLHQLEDKDGSLTVEQNAIDEYQDDGTLLVGEIMKMWEFTAAYNPGRYRIDITVTDDKDNEGKYSGYFTIESNATPWIIPESMQPLTSVPFFGGPNGDVTISGKARIHEASIVGRVTLAWVIPDDDQEKFNDRQLLYTNRDYEGWDIARKGSGKQIDSANYVVLWDVADIRDLGPGEEEETKEFSFSIDLNVFNDLLTGLGAGKYPPGPHAFLIRVEGSQPRNDGKIRSSVYTAYSPTGDNEAPKLEITKVHITRVDRDGIPAKKPKEDLEWKDVQETILDSLEAGDSIWFEGTWTDDSLKAWYGLSESQLKTYFGYPTIYWDGEENEQIPTFEVDNFGITGLGTSGIEGYWSSTRYTFGAKNLDFVVYIRGELTDMSGNVGSLPDQPMMIATNNPTLSRISSTTSDGVYGGENKLTEPYLYPDGGKPIFIVLEFNKPVKFSGENKELPEIILPPDAPELILNNGGRAYYLDGNGKNRMEFVYYVDGDDFIGLLDEDGLTDAEKKAAREQRAGGSTRKNNTQGDISNHLTVTGIDPKKRNSNGSPDFSEWLSVDNNDFLMFADVYGEGGESLARSKRIIIDREPPVITGITSNTSNTRQHGVGSTIYITVNFDKDIQAVGGNNMNLILSGVTGAPAAIAEYSAVSGLKSISFVYTVEAGQNTAVSPVGYLGIESIHFGSGALQAVINDEAGNLLDIDSVAADWPILRSEGANANLRVKTLPPAAPRVPAIAKTQYAPDGVTFRIEGIESTDTIVEYTTNASAPTVVWTTAPKATAGAAGNYYIDVEIPTMNGTYSIVARQYDDANPRNASLPSTPPVEFTVDKGNLLERVTSLTTSDGVKTTGGDITIDLIFRKELNVTGPNSISLTLQDAITGAGNADSSTIHTTGTPVASNANNKTTLTFTYRVQNGDNMERLDVTNLNMGSAQFTDENGTDVTGMIHLDTVLSFASQKSIEILTGYPVITYEGKNLTDTVQTVTLISKNRRVFRSGKSGVLPVTIKQDANNYRIPAVLSIDEWNALFTGRNDLVENPHITNNPVTSATFWQQIGEYLYQQGSNGADPKPGSTSNELESDTTIKYVLRYEVDTRNVPSSIAGITSTQLHDVFREAEAISFEVTDKDIQISTDRYCTIVFDIAAKGRLPVKGASYTFTFPAGFFVDYLDNENLAGVTETLEFSGYTEKPVIRIDKGSDTVSISGTGTNRQAIQPVQADCRIDCRTPNTTITYRTRQTNDNVGRLIWRTYPRDFYHETWRGATTDPKPDGICAGETDPEYSGSLWPNTYQNGNYMRQNDIINIRSHHLPNLGSQISIGRAYYSDGGLIMSVYDYQSFEQTKNRPQSGQSTGGNIYQGTKPNGYNMWEPMSATWNNGSTNPFKIGTTNYNDGGMIVHIEATATVTGTATATTATAYEAAYRSVLVFNNANINGNNSNILDIGRGGIGSELDPPGSGNYIGFGDFGNRGRIYVRGGDAISGDASVPDFPISRDRSKYRKARLLTPIRIGTGYPVGTGYPTGNDFNEDWNNNQSNETTNNAKNATIGSTTVADGHDVNHNYNTNGQYIWFWVTWGINVNAYVDLFVGELPTTDDGVNGPGRQQDFYGAYIMAKEHYPVIPGRTTVLETRDMWGVYIDGSHGKLRMGTVETNPTKVD